MDAMETPQQKLTRVTREVGTVLREQVGRRWKRVRTAERNEGRRHVWRFRTGEGEPDRYLHLSHRAMIEGKDPTTTLVAQLQQAHWLDRMQKGPETSFILAPSGRLRPHAAD